MMNDQGFAKKASVICPVEIELPEGAQPGVNVCRGLEHDFMCVGTMQKHTYTDNDKQPPQELVVYQNYVCTKCLLHVYVETQRVKVSDLERGIHVERGNGNNPEQVM